MATNPVPPPEAALIRQRRRDRLPALSVRDAAAAASAAGVAMSEAGWRSIESGRYDGPPDKIAIMAQVVGITPGELAEVGQLHHRPAAVAAAKLVESYLRDRAAREPVLAEVPESAPEAVLQMLLEGLDDIRRAPGFTDAQKSSLEKTLIHSVMQTLSSQLVQIRETLEIVQGKHR